MNDQDRDPVIVAAQQVDAALSRLKREVDDAQDFQRLMFAWGTLCALEARLAVLAGQAGHAADAMLSRL